MSRIESKDYYVFTKDENDVVRCSLKGRFKKEFNMKKDKLYLTDIVAVGDYVDYDLNEDGTGSIYNIEKRINYISRKAPKMKGSSYRGERLEQIIASNVDNFFIITSIFEPLFNNKVVDRLLVVGESANLNCYIIINKEDLDQENLLSEWEKLYSTIGYKVIRTSAKNNIGLDKLKKLFTGKKNVLWGQSGVGKSSLLNKIYSQLNLKTKLVSTFNEKGTHSTVTSTMFRINQNTFVIDTPGIREIDPYGIRKEDLGHYFKDFLPYIKKCRFNTCTHNHEPDCEVIRAVEDEKIFPERYDSYLKLLDTIEQDIIF
ncbi:MAG: ribosome small subunit-dependent GTPase A [Ignavibacteriaceae bacterium]|nr:ribosome small subunit-dependent GTPase A [Ignavibacteriaceae bacterium]